MKKLNSMAMAFALAGFASSVFAGTATDNSNAGALHSSTTVHFNGLVEPSTCSFQGKSMKVSLPVVTVADFDGLSMMGQPAKNVSVQPFQLHINCTDAFNGDRIRMKISGNADHNVLENTHGNAKGVGIELLNSSGEVLPIGTELDSATAGITNAFHNRSNNLDLKAQYVRSYGDVSSGKLATDAVFEIYYK